MHRYWNWLSKNDRTPRSAKGKPRRSHNLQMENLEDRKLMVVGAFEGSAPEVHPGEIVQGLALDGVVRVRDPNGGYGTGALLSSGRHVLTAAHVLFATDANGSLLKDANGNYLVDSSQTVIFDVPGMAPITVTAANYRFLDTFDPSAISVRPMQDDIAVLILPQVVTGVPRYELNYDTTELYHSFMLVGYGNTGTGEAGATPYSGGIKHWGTNKFDVGIVGSLLMYDFDNPNLDPAALWSESNTGKGDSGGPLFVNGRIAGVQSSGDSGGNPIDAKTFEFGTGGYATRVSDFAHWIDEIVGYSPEYVLDMNQIYGGNNGVADTIEARVNGGSIEFYVNGSIVHTRDLNRTLSIKIKGSGDDDTIIVDAGLTLKLYPVDGGGGQNKLEINDRSAKATFTTGANPTPTATEYKVSNSRVTLGSRGTLAYVNIRDLKLETTHYGANVDFYTLPTGTTTINGGNGSDTFNVGNSTGSLDALALGGTMFARTGTLAITGGLGQDQMMVRDVAPATWPDFTISESKVVRSRSQPITVDGIPRFATYTALSE